MATKKKPTKKKATRRASDRTAVDPGSDPRYVRRDQKGRFNEVDDVGRAAAQDQKRQAKTKSRKGQGDRGDR
jgi:hypothetical protein